MSGGWLCWQDERLLVVTGEGQIRSQLQEPVPIDRLDEIGFAVGKSWQLVLPGQDGPHFFISPDGTTWQSVPSPPVQHHQPELSIGLHPAANCVSVIDGEVLHFYGVTRTWQRVSLPAGAIWASAEREDIWWAVGSRPSQRVRTADREVALWRWGGAGYDWIDIAIQASWWDAYHAIRDGGFEQLRAVDARSSPLVLASECAWFLDDPSWFLFVRLPSGKFAIQRLSGKVLARIERSLDGAPIAITTDGELWNWDGRQWRARGSAARIQNIMNASYGATPYHVHLALHADEIYGVASTFSQGAASQRVAIHSVDHGRSWRIVNLDTLYGCQPIAGWAG